MPITQEINNQIANFSLSNKSDEMISYIQKKIENAELTVQELLIYARDYRFKNNQEYVITPENILKLGRMIYNLKNDERRKEAYHFLTLAADREDGISCYTLAHVFFHGDQLFNIEKSMPKAYEYIQKANIKLSGTNYSEYKLLFYKISKAMGIQSSQTNIMLMQYLNLKYSEYTNEKNEEKKKAILESIREAQEFCSETLNIFLAQLDENKTDDSKLALFKSILDQVAPFFNLTESITGIASARQTAFYIKGKCHENLGENKEAMQAHCAIKDKASPYYADSVEARKRLLKQQIRKEIENEGESVNDIARRLKLLSLPADFPLPVNFKEYWKKESNYFDSVGESELKDLLDKRMSQISRLINIKSQEKSVIEEVQDEENSDTLNERIKLHQEEIIKLKKDEKSLQEIYNRYDPEYRQPYRRFAAERNFFNPKRSRKKDKLIELAEKIIDHRYQISQPDLTPIDLSGISSRLFMTAERAIQEAIISLTDSATPLLGIPRAREKPWSLETEYGESRSGTIGYGPVERYKINNTEIQSEHRTSPKRNRLGDSFLPQHRAYNNDIFPTLNCFSDGEKENEMKLAEIMIRYGKTHQGITLAELKEIYKEAKQEDVDHFNRICFLILGKEQVQWHSAKDETYQIGMAAAQARCLIMIKAGYLSFREVFKNNQFFGIYSTAGIYNEIYKVKEACDRIEKLYKQYLTSKPEEYLPFFKKQLSDKTTRTLVLSRQQAHRDMKYVYGGDSDTDDQGYQSDLGL